MRTDVAATMDSKPDRRANVRLGLTLASIALVFFVGVIAARYFGPEGGGLTVLGLAIVVFLVVAIGRSVRSRR